MVYLQVDLEKIFSRSGLFCGSFNNPDSVLFLFQAGRVATIYLGVMVTHNTHCGLPIPARFLAGFSLASPWDLAVSPLRYRRAFLFASKLF